MSDLRPFAVICDIDGTVSDPTHRRHLVTGDSPDWETFESLCGEDLLHNHVACVINLLSPFYRIILTTGRQRKHEFQTTIWLNRYWVRYHELFMRPDGDTRPDEVVKEEILDTLILPKYRPAMAFDDRSKIVAMWRRRGIPCFQVAEGDF